MTTRFLLLSITFQQQLLPIDACHIEYAGRDKRGNRKHFDALFIETCSHGSSLCTCTRTALPERPWPKAGVDRGHRAVFE